MEVYVAQSSLPERGWGRPKAATELPKVTCGRAQGDPSVLGAGQTAGRYQGHRGLSAQCSPGWDSGRVRQALSLGSGIFSGKTIPSWFSHPLTGMYHPLPFIISVTDTCDFVGNGNHCYFHIAVQLMQRARKTVSFHCCFRNTVVVRAAVRSCNLMHSWRITWIAVSRVVYYFANYILILFVSLVTLCILLLEFKSVSSGNTDITVWHRRPTLLASLFPVKGTHFGLGEPRLQAELSKLGPQRGETRRKYLASPPPLAYPGSASFGNTRAPDKKSWSCLEDSSVQQGPGRHGPETLPSPTGLFRAGGHTQPGEQCCLSEPHPFPNFQEGSSPSRQIGMPWLLSLLPEVPSSPPSWWFGEIV